MTPDQFSAAVADTRLKPAQVSAARRVLVDDEAQADVAADLGMAKQQVSRAVQRVKEAAGLVTVSVTLPADRRAALLEWIERNGGAVE